MVRVAFLTAGLTLALWGAALFGIEEVTLSQRVGTEDTLLVNWLSQVSATGRRVVHPPDWLSYTCVGVGGVTMLYAVALPRK